MARKKQGHLNKHDKSQYTDSNIFREHCAQPPPFGHDNKRNEVSVNGVYLK